MTLYIRCVFVCRSNDSARPVQKMSGADNKGVSIPVSNSISNEYQILNPHQLYPLYTSQSVTRMKSSSAANYNKPPVYRQETDCRYGVSFSFINTHYAFI